uniref:Transmembrane protein 221 n=1 Tax=Salvator merianae TaxID=96440 RepID=A0A8D0EE16_SALMN
MSSPYGQRALGALILFGTVAGLMAVLASTLIFQIQAGRQAEGSAAAAAAGGGFPEGTNRLLLRASAVLASLCLVLSLSCLLLSLLHGYCCAERCAPGDWFLLDSREVRHVAVGLFCCGVSAYLAVSNITVAYSIADTGITSACILSSGIVVLFFTVTHTLIRASRAARRSQTDLSHTLYENDSARSGEEPSPHLNNAKDMAAAARPRPEIHREFSYPPFMEQKSHLTTPASSNLTSSGSAGLSPEKESYPVPRMHRTLSAESGLLPAHGKPWNGVTQEMRNVLSRKSGATGKDSTLV